MNISISRLDYADFFFLGNGPEGSYVSVGIERKAIKDLLNSMTTGRLSGHQLPGMSQQYDYIYILVEGEWRFSPDNGILQSKNGAWWNDVCLGPRRFMAKEVIGFLNTLVVKAGVQVMYSRNQRETVQVVTSLYHWWNTKQWEGHTSHLSPSKSHKGNSGEIMLIKPPLIRRIASELPLIGWGKSKAVADFFPSVSKMVNATEKEWREIPGIGKGIAQGVVEELNKENF
jgi:ERCC4-type nuclease